MNSYNDNLHSTVASSLLNQELTLKSVVSQQNAAMFTLYHAEAASITAEENLDTAREDMDKKLSINNQAVAGVNISNNLLGAATQSSTYLKQSVTNTAVCAANVQIAANAVLKLAGDVGNIYSIVHAADYKSDIYDTTAEARTLMNETAYLAEVASDLSMQSSILMAEVPGTAVLDKAKNSNTSLGNLYSITTSDFNNASQLVTTDTNNLATASVTERAAEGQYADISVETRATALAYEMMNTELNLNLRVSPVKREITGKNPSEIQTVRNIRFRFIRSPFKWEVPAGASVNYPVQNYYLIAVKDNSKTTFSMANAENIVHNGADDANPRFITVPEESRLFTEVQNKSAKGEPISQKLQKELLEPKRTATGILVHLQPTEVNMDVDFFNVNGKVLFDSDGEAMKWGTRYVIFVYAQYQETYKKKINNFDDYLSAPSLSFVMRKPLEAVPGPNIKLPQGDSNQISFKISKTPDCPVEFRCMFLPVGADIPAGMLNMLTTEQMLEDSMRIQQIFDQFDPKIALEQAKLLNPEIKPEDKKKSEEEIVTLQTAKLAAINAVTPLSLQTVRSKKVVPAVPVTGNKIGFLFNITLAEQVAPGNYVPAPVDPLTIDVTKDITFGIDDKVTDIFGTLLKPGSSYLPVVLSAYNGLGENAAMYENTWSGYVQSPVYTYTVKATPLTPPVTKKK